MAETVGHVKDVEKPAKHKKWLMRQDMNVIDIMEIIASRGNCLYVRISKPALNGNGTFHWFGLLGPLRYEKGLGSLFLFRAPYF